MAHNATTDTVLQLTDQQQRKKKTYSAWSANPSVSKLKRKSKSKRLVLWDQIVTF